jgi:FixJ family two-component response regulator
LIDGRRLPFDENQNAPCPVVAYGLIAADTPRANRPAEMKQGPAQRTVLLVDDDAALRSSLEFILGIEGYAVRTYSRGRDLLDDKNLPEHGCLVIDQRLPDIEGLKLIDALRARSVRLPAILITTHPNRMLRRRAEQANVAIVEKPLITGDLFQRIGALLN